MGQNQGTACLLGLCFWRPLLGSLVLPGKVVSAPVTVLVRLTGQISSFPSPVSPLCSVKTSALTEVGRLVLFPVWPFLFALMSAMTFAHRARTCSDHGVTRTQVSPPCGKLITRATTTDGGKVQQAGW